MKSYMYQKNILNLTISLNIKGPRFITINATVCSMSYLNLLISYDLLESVLEFDV